MKSCPSSVFSFSITDNALPNKTGSSQANSEEERSKDTRKVGDRSRHFVCSRPEERMERRADLGTNGVSLGGTSTSDGHTWEISK